MQCKPQSVMIVEDEVVTQRYLRDIFFEQNISVVSVVNNANDALRYLKKGYCDLILMDINIRGSIDGLRLAKRILKKYDVCIIFLTAYRDEDTLNEAVELSPYGFVIKPFDSNDIIASVKIGYKRFFEYNSISMLKDEQECNVVNLSEELKYDSLKKMLFQNDIAEKLSFLEIKFMDIMIKNINSIVSNELIISTVFTNDKNTLDSLRALIYRLRKRFPSLPLITYSKIGYMLQSHNKIF